MANLANHPQRCSTQITMLIRFADFVASKPLPFVFALLLLAGVLLWSCLFILLRCLLAYRKLAHTERIQMIEAGQSTDLLKSFDNQSRRNQFLSVALGLGVPCTAFIGATWVALGTEDPFAISLVAWICATIASMTSAICATLIMVRQYDVD